jgi:hypothetical protein
MIGLVAQVLHHGQFLRLHRVDLAMQQPR